MKKNRKSRTSSIITLVFVLALFFVMRTLINTGAINTYIADIINLICINIIAAVSLNMVTGHMGQLVLGHAGFMLVGSYIGAFVTKGMGVSLTASLPIALLLGGAVSALFGIAIGIPALRLKGDYLAIVTLGFGEIIRVVANALKITNGAKGYYGYPTFSARTNPMGMFNFIFLIAAFVIFFSYRLSTSRHGRAVLSIREDELASESSGIHTTFYKLLMFAISAFFAGVAGVLYSHQVGMIDPAKFDFNRSVEILMIVVLGGMGSITGSVFSATILTILPETLRGFANYRMLVYSIVLIAVMLFRPEGLFGRKELHLIASIKSFVAKIRSKKKPKDKIAVKDKTETKDTENTDTNSMKECGHE